MLGGQGFTLTQTCKLAMTSILSVSQQMVLAWSLDQLIDLNNGLDTSHPLAYREELLCLISLFSFSVVVLVVALIKHYLCTTHALQKQSKVASWMTVGYLMLGQLILADLFVRTEHPSQMVQNQILIPLIAASFVLLIIKRELVKRMAIHHSSQGLILGSIWIESLSSVAMYFYIGRPDLSMILDPYGANSTHDLMPDIVATGLYAISIVFQVLSTKQSDELQSLSGFTRAHFLLPLAVLILRVFGPVYVSVAIATSITTYLGL